MKWEWEKFEEISGEKMHEILSVRQEVFVVEQNCPYQDADELDKKSFHLIGRDKNDNIVAYTRLVFPGFRFKQPSPGRVLIRKENRKSGLGEALLSETISKCNSEYPGMGIRISAQTYLLNFYKEFGFEVIGEPYDEDGIEHVDMLKL